MNIILVIVDTLRYDAVSANADGNPVGLLDGIPTPNLDRVASESIRFDNVFCASFPTIPFRTDFITGNTGSPFHIWKPLPHGAWTFVRHLAEEHGYATQLIHDTPHLVNGGHNFDYPFHAWQFIRGGEVDRAWIDDEIVWPANWKKSPLFDVLGDDAADTWHNRVYCRTNRNRTDADWNCRRLFETAAECLRRNARRENLLLWVDCFDPHEPWDAPPEFIRRFSPAPDADGTVDPRSFQANRNKAGLSPEARAVIASQYAAKAHWMDHCFGKFLDTFFETGLDRTSALLVMGDHGTCVGEQGRFGKGNPLHEAITHIPLLVRLPTVETGRCDALAQPQDITATVLGLADSSVPDHVDGRDLLALARGDAPRHRDIVLSGGSANGWGRHYFNVSDGAHTLAWTPDAAQSTLRAVHTDDNIAGGNPEPVATLHAAGLEEIARRGAHPGLLAWLRAGGGDAPPDNVPLYDGWPGPEGYRVYFQRLYNGP